MIVTAIGVVSAEWHEDASIEQRQGTTLILSSWIETDAERREPCRDIDWKSGQDDTVDEPEAVDEVSRCAAISNHRIRVGCQYSGCA
jgi:hypothetical protein